MLTEIIAHKRGEVAARRTQRPLAQIKRDAQPTARSLRAALTRRRPGLILECKRASPSAGALRPTLDLGSIAAAYRGVADAVSVLTDSHFFDGSLMHLAQLRARLDLPLLCKDFVIDPYQVVEARLHGADAVLLMLSVLDDADWRACMAEARRLGMDALTEVHDEAEMARARALGADLIGINNRDLRTLAIDLGTTARLAPHAPHGALLVAESGIAGRDDLRRLAPSVDALLVGSSLMRAPDLDRAVRALAYGRFKVCGLTRAADVIAAAASGATYGGFNFVPGSPRCIAFSAAVELVAAAPLVAVGVFADAPLTAVFEATEMLRFGAIQLHGTEDRVYLDTLRRGLPDGIEIWKAVAVRSSAVPRPDALGADRVVLDAPHPTLAGGTGRSFDWRLLARLGDRERYLLAGGLDACNVARADALALFALDTCSGVESAPGLKDPVALAAFGAALRAAPAGAQREVPA